MSSIQRKFRWSHALLAGALALTGGSALAHEPVAKCVKVDASQIRCKGATTDGDGIPDATLNVLSQDDQLLLTGKLDRSSSFTFKRPAQPFYVVLDVGPGLMVVIEQEEIG
ncbi:hypothetical protein [Steroidobacter sp.]|uniref:hypothetical protein n=1 Tax=Steroidobacter sp. TaxID=1978227 RepID=UPI001A57AEF6|nr:hypothetical protein [Steroidobacter sp.]MBL8269673.1 hypothetical protein [Steroidobacter sp.]